MLVDSHCHLDRLDLSAHDGSLDAALLSPASGLVYTALFALYSTLFWLVFF